MLEGVCDSIVEATAASGQLVAGCRTAWETEDGTKLAAGGVVPTLAAVVLGQGGGIPEGLVEDVGGVLGVEIVGGGGGRREGEGGGRRGVHVG